MNSLGTRVIAYGVGSPFDCINFDNDADADSFIASLTASALLESLFSTEELADEFIAGLSENQTLHDAFTEDDMIHVEYFETTVIPYRELTEEEITAQFGDCPQWAGDENTTQTGDTLETVVFARVHPVTLEMLKEQVCCSLCSNADKAISSAMSKYPDLESKSWEKQERDYVAYTADNLASTPFVDAMLSSISDETPEGVTPMTKAELMSKIGANIAAFETAAANVVGQRVEKKRQVNAATTVAEVNAIDIVITIPTISLTDK